MFERFTDSGRQIIVKAQAYAKELNHDAIGAEHLLLALASAGERPVTVALGAMSEIRGKIVWTMVEQGSEDVRPSGPLFDRASVDDAVAILKGSERTTIMVERFSRFRPVPTMRSAP
jgi:ATP-dependent Clp protease ATP-binding subunit ClpA